jgi:hypothetical protein
MFRPPKKRAKRAVPEGEHRATAEVMKMVADAVGPFVQEGLTWGQFRDKPEVLKS